MKAAEEGGVRIFGEGIYHSTIPFAGHRVAESWSSSSYRGRFFHLPRTELELDSFLADEG